MNDALVLVTAYGLLGDGAGGEWLENREYTRAIVDLIADLVPVDPEILDKGGDDKTPFILGMILGAQLATPDFNIAVQP